MTSSSSLTNDEIRHRILKVYAQFVSDVDPDRLCDWLVQELVITIDQKRRIRHENPIASDRCRALLDHLFSIQHPRTFLIVRKALSKENHYLLEDIDNQESGCGIPEQAEKQSVLPDKITTPQLESDNVHVDKKGELEVEKDRLLEMRKEPEEKLKLDKTTIPQLESDNMDKGELVVDNDRLLEMRKEIEANRKRDNPNSVMKGELMARTTHHRSAEGPVMISMCSNDGKYVSLKNTGRKDEELFSWKLTRNIDGKDVATHKFNYSFALRPGQEIKVWAKGTRPFTGATDDMESNQNWGVGLYTIITKLVNPIGEDRATYTQKTTYAQRFTC